MRPPQTDQIPKDFSEVILSLTPPEKILQASHGEVTQPETRNYRTYKSIEGGLFCDRIFGPDEDWKCRCGKYASIKYKYTVCDRCGVEINRRRVRRERMGHMKLPIPIVHIWYHRYQPNKIGHLLGIPTKQLNNIIYYSNYIVLQAGEAAEQGVKKMDTLSERA